MKFYISIAVALAVIPQLSHPITNAVSIPNLDKRTPDAYPDYVAQHRRLAEAEAEAIAAPQSLNPAAELQKRRLLEKRRGGGGGGGRGGGGGSSGGSSGGGRSGSGSSSSGGSSGGRTSTGSNSGGRTISGSGTRPIGGGYYGGGAAVPYTAGLRSPRLGIFPFLLPVATLALLFPGLWLASVWAYPFYDQRVNYYNRTLNQTQNLPVLCLCQYYSVCSCDDNSNSTYLESLPENITRVAKYNDTLTLIINGTLENGTTATGGTDDGTSNGIKTVFENFGWVVVAVLVSSFVLL